MSEKAKIDLIKIESGKILLDAISAELNDHRTETLDDAKAIVDAWRLLYTLLEKLEKGEIEAFIAEIKKLCETDPKKALQFALDGASGMLEAVGLDN